MFDKLRSLLNPAEQEGTPGSDIKPYQLAVTALLIEAASLDGEIGPLERATIARLVSEKFNLNEKLTAKLFEEARTQQENAVELSKFTRTIKDTFDADERTEMIEMLWEVVYADKVLHDFEANLLRRVTGLLYVPDRAAGEAKKRVRERLGIDAG